MIETLYNTLYIVGRDIELYMWTPWFESQIHSLVHLKEEILATMLLNKKMLFKITHI